MILSDREAAGAAWTCRCCQLSGTTWAQLIVGLFRRTTLDVLGDCALPNPHRKRLAAVVAHEAEATPEFIMVLRVL